MGTENTKRRIILAAERLFAERGIDDVSMRQITEAAGQKNASALNYHFGSRHALVEAVFAYRMGALDAHRSTLLDAVEADGRADDLLTLIHLLAQPLADQMDERMGENDYLSFFSQVIANPDLRYREMVSGKYDHALVRINAHIIRLLRHLPENTVRQRLTVVTATSIHALCDFQHHMRQSSGGWTRDELERFMVNLCDMIAGSLTAPVTEYISFRKAYPHLYPDGERAE